MNDEERASLWRLLEHIEAGIRLTQTHPPDDRAARQALVEAVSEMRIDVAIVRRWLLLVPRR